MFKTSGQYSKTHAGLKSLSNEQFIKSKKLESRFAKIYANLFELRQEADYGDVLILDKDDIEPLIFSIQELLTKIKNLIK